MDNTIRGLQNLLILLGTYKTLDGYRASGLSKKNGVDVVLKEYAREVDRTNVISQNHNAISSFRAGNVQEYDVTLSISHS